MRDSDELVKFVIGAPVSVFRSRPSVQAGSSVVKPVGVARWTVGLEFWASVVGRVPTTDVVCSVPRGWGKER